jgi:hypothetical protein
MMTIVGILKANSQKFTYLANFLYNADFKEIMGAAISRVNAIAKDQQEIVLSEKHFSQLILFLDAATGTGLFDNPRKDFNKLARNKIKIIKAPPLIINTSSYSI